MNFIVKWVSEIVAVVVALFVLKSLIPDGSLRKYADMVLGIVLLSVILKPVATNQIERLFEDVSTRIESSNVIAVASDSSNLKAASSDKALVMSVAEKQLKNTLLSFLLNEMPSSVSDVNLQMNFDGYITKVEIILSDFGADKGYIRSKIRDNFSIDPSTIVFVTR